MSPSGESVAFILDDYVAEKPLYTQSFHHSTASELVGAEHTEWLADEGLAVLSLQDGAGGQGAGVTPNSGSLFGAPSDGSSDVRRIADGVTAAGAPPEGGAIAAIEVPSESPEEPVWSRLVRLRSSDEPTMVYLRSIKGTVSGLSVSPDGQMVVMATRRVTDDGEVRYEVQTFRLSDGSASRVTRLPAGMEILGAPQWTQGGILYVAGKVGDQAGTDRNPALYALYRVPPGSDTPESVPGVGEDFVAANISVSPDGGRLAVVGRRNPGSPTNLYVLDLASDTLQAATANDNMEIKTNPLDLAWSPDGRYVILVARGALSGPTVYDGPAQSLSSAFYNLYEVPVGNLPVEGSSEG